MKGLRKINVTKMENEYVAQQEKKAQSMKKKKRGLRRRLTLYGICLFVFFIFAVVTIVSQNAALNEKAQQKEKIDSELAALKKEEKVLKEQIVRLNDDEYIAKIVRRDYFLSEEGEIIFNLPKNNEDSD
ncbi:FtsB family cell division protein [Peribacillus asahii]|uniref:Cell division protein DIVIC n=1 Tax=Peribacillus asahii TaxID=228899 RepID=A0A3T0KK86_9BACI|nr:septum formation initiator family protein [Peribacillus asahii]AZV40809.1 cell division protein DIVIC [Peribacillus asahii]USK85249.1 septum formation initiator family protein [Peribacillus asahii]